MVTTGDETLTTTTTVRRGKSIIERLLKCCFTSTETVGILGTGAQDGHLDFHTAPELSRTPVDFVVEVLLYIHRNRRYIRDGSPGRPPRLSHSSSNSDVAVELI